MNNSQMYEYAHAGGVPYPETDKYYYERWFPTSGLTDGSEYKTIRFNVKMDNLILHWTNAYMVLDGQLVKKADGGEYAGTEMISMIHNAVPHLFSNCKLKINNTCVEDVSEVGHVSSMMYDVLFSRSKGKNDGLQFMWYPDITPDATDDNKGFAARRAYLFTQPDTKGSFKLWVPLYLFFGFMENFVVLTGYPMELEFVRGPDYPALFRNAIGGTAAGEGKLKFTSITLDVPIVQPSTSIMLEYIKGIKDRGSYLYSFRQRNGMFAPIPPNVRDFQQTITSAFFTERPQMIWVGFQISGTIDQTVNHALYKHTNVQSMYVRMNNVQVPHTLVESNWAENDSGFFYEMQKHVRGNYLQYPARYAEGNTLTPANFNTLYTIYCFDVSKQELTLGSNNVTCDLHVKFRTATPANLRVYITWFNDRTLELFTDGSPINIRKEIENYDEMEEE